MIPCQRTGCSGHYSPDGYCDECGLKASAAVSAQLASPSARGPAGVGAPAVSTGAGVSGPSGRTGPSQPTRPGGGPSQRGQRGQRGLSTPSGRRAGLGTPSGNTSRGQSSGFGTPSGGSTRSGRTGGRGRLGANLVTIPPVPLRDPATAVLKDPSVPESQRFCSQCGEPVGRGRDGQPGRTEGFCPRDRTRYSFVPALKPGDVVDKRYEILGALAHGGLGWIYLGRDRNISDAGSDRWVVLKGLINSGDADAMAAAVTERRFLVEVDHPNIVKIHDFANHPDPITGEPVGYIVMEYVGGRSLKDLALAHRGPDGKRQPLPLEQVLAYGLEVLPAFGYLHDRALLFCDFKPDNVIHAEEQLKLIDLGAVRRIGDNESALYGTPGYQAPELATAGPSIGSDLYTVGRTLAVLSFDFTGFTSRWAESLPPAEDVPLLAAEESYHRLLLRATHRIATKRFVSAAEMGDQMMGVLRETLAAGDGVERPAASGLFTPERLTFGVAAIALRGVDVAYALPLPLVDPTDPGAAYVATLGATDPSSTIQVLASVSPSSLEVSLRLIRAHLEAGQLDPANAALRVAAREAPGDWRLDWYGGLIALVAADYPLAQTRFDAVYSALPGEPAARLALAAASELARDWDAATGRYERVWRVDHGYLSAAFGLARCLAATGDRDAAVAILDEVPETSSQHVSARVAALRTRLDAGDGVLTEGELVDASARLEAMRLDAERHATLSVEMFRAALAWLGVSLDGPTAGGRPSPQQRAAMAFGQRIQAGPAGQPTPLPLPGPRPAPAAVTSTARVLGQRMTERELRLGLERAYRALAALQTDTLQRYALVDRANAVRPRTMV